MATEHPGFSPDDHKSSDDVTEKLTTPGFAEPAAALPGMPNPLEPPSGATDSDPTADTSAQGEPTRRMRGSIQRQEEGITKPRPPTLAETRAREKARKRAEEAERAAAEALEEKRRRRKKMMIGGAAVVGVAAVVGAGYLVYEAATTPDEPVTTAYCTVTDPNGNPKTVVDDDECVRAQSYATGAGTYHAGMPPIFILGNGTQYRYYYGGNNTVGRPPTGGSTIEPSRGTVSTKSGTVVRGGLGAKSGGSSGGGSKSGGS
ncbi:hypothetical protein [Nocardia terpenica]|uniref:hypothetical protein n=1 Tax=Nocardia terpenica TaxID=455432 RepID=UPI000AFF1FFC|nr:hypothetical protein [Nocardia terpenica]